MIDVYSIKRTNRYGNQKIGEEIRAKANYLRRSELFNAMTSDQRLDMLRKADQERVSGNKEYKKKHPLFGARMDCKPTPLHLLKRIATYRNLWSESLLADYLDTNTPALKT